MSRIELLILAFVFFAQAIVLVWSSTPVLFVLPLFAGFYCTGKMIVRDIAEATRDLADDLDG